MSLVVLTGWGGNISLGQFGIVGIGADGRRQPLTAGTSTSSSPWRAAVVAGALVAVAIGLPALRIRGLYLAVTTIAFAVALDSYFLNPVNFPDFVPDQHRSARCSGSGSTSPSQWVRYDVLPRRRCSSPSLVVRAVRRHRGRAA